MIYLCRAQMSLKIVINKTIMLKVLLIPSQHGYIKTCLMSFCGFITEYTCCYMYNMVLKYTAWCH